MARWADDLSDTEATSMRGLFDQLISLKPDGWSVVQGDREIIIRSADRGLGKFSVTIFHSEFRIAFFSPSRNHWDGDSHFLSTQDCAGTMLEWAEGKLEAERIRRSNNSA